MSLAETSIKRPIFITCIVTLMLVLGYTSLKKMSVDLFPDVTFPVVFVQTIYPGASPVDMEKLVSKPIEDELGSLAGLNKISSQNAESVSYVILEFKLGTDIKDTEQQVRQRIGNIRRNLPDEIDEPIIRRFDPADQAIVRLAIVSEMDRGALFDVVDETLKPMFETVGGVGQVNIIGGRKREIKVDVNRDKLQERNLSLLQISDRIKNTSKDVPVGKLEVSDKETVLRASGEFNDVESLKKVNVNFVGSDQGVFLEEIADVRMGLVDETSSSSLMTRESGFQRRSSVYLDIFKQSGANTVGVVDAVLAQILKANDLMKAKQIEAKVELVREAARPIRLNIADVFESIVIGIILCVIVVFFFLGSGRSTFITGMALPNSLLGAFVIMFAMGFTINIMTLLALSLAVGLLIDDAIVVRENIFRHMEMGKDPKEAALVGTKEVTLAVIATTSVVLAVFGPIAFLDGIVGQFFKQFGLTICFAMIISTFDAFTVAPMLSAYMASHTDHTQRKGPIGRMLGAFDRFQTRLENMYEKVLIWTIKHRMKTLVAAAVIFFLSLSLVAFIPKTFLPGADNGEFVVTVERPVGSAMTATKDLAERVEEVISKDSTIELLSTVVGASLGPAEANKASIYAKLVPAKNRKENTTQVKERIRHELKAFESEAIINVGDIDIGGGGQKVYNLSLSAENLEELSKYVEKLKPRLAKIPGLADVDTNYRTGKPEFQVKFNRSRSESLGVSTVTAGAELRARVEGIIPATYRDQGKEYDIRVRLREEDRDIRTNFADTLVPNTNFNMIPLSKVAEGKESFGYSQINRQNKARYIMVTANLGPKGSLGSVTADTEKLLKEDPEFKAPPGIEYRFVGQAEDFKDLMNNMMVAMGLGVLFIYLVLSSLYESFITPFSILLALPLAMCGALLALFITGKSIDIFSLIGIVMLLGVVAKNSILLVDYANQLIQHGEERSKALIQAGKVRLRPILMTSLALIAGMIPIAIGLNEASAQRTSMGAAIIGGLISSTILTLVVVPAAFGYIDDFRMFLGRHLSRFGGQGAQKKKSKENDAAMSH